MASTAVVPRSQGRYPAHCISSYPAAPLSAAVAFFFFAICLDSKKGRLSFFSFKQRHKSDEAETMSPLAQRKFCLAFGTTVNGFFQVPVSSRA